MIGPMDQQSEFSYTYSAPENQEVLNIRNKYLPKQETKLEELKRLDALVQSAGVVEALCLGIGGCLVFGVGMCFCLGVLGSVTWPGLLLGLVGTVGMLFAYPIHRKRLAKSKQTYTPRILELAAELTGESR